MSAILKGTAKIPRWVGSTILATAARKLNLEFRVIDKHSGILFITVAFSVEGDEESVYQYHEWLLEIGDVT